ncbi:Butyrate--acetoacetate CoA-transferase subunit B [uncultured Flavonifractor sp.]|nr:propionate CoA-transferase [Oscillospiraceae bacterium]CUQ22681.1 coenzyme A transferase [Flavonifractor plautii]SCI82723.1 Butyrate--acetoacetate CoA-transferase subunit B [uncultured Flavonifractor sp.]
MSKRVSIDQAIDMIHDGDGIAISGFQSCTVSRELYLALAERFRTTGHPCGLTLMQGAGNTGVQDMTEEGLFSRYITGHYAGNQKMIQMVIENKIQSYNLPQGVVDHMYRAAAGGKIGEITKIGLHTFCDPRLGGGKMNEITTEDLVELTDICGEEYLVYKTPKLDIALVRGTTSDELGNITIEEESAPVDLLDVVMGVKGMGGKVIVQVKNYVSSGSMDRSQVVIPGSMVDAVVVCTNPEENHRQTPAAFYDPILSGHFRANDIGFDTLPLNDRKVIARRAAMELAPNSVVNLGIGIPEGVAKVASEEGIADRLCLTIESGLIGGVPAGGAHFGSSYNAWAALSMTHQFDYYDGGNLDICSLGFAEVDPAGNVNVSRFGNRIAGAGGFIDISQSTPKVAFSGTMTAGGLRLEIRDGTLHILEEGQKKKFLRSIGQITFSAAQSRRAGQKVLFITERCVFEVTEKGLMLTEIAPGITIEEHILPCMEFEPLICPNLKLMDARIFREEPMGLASIIGAK